MAITNVTGAAAFSVTTLTLDVTAGDLIVVQFRAAQTVVVASIADTVGSTYRRAIHENNMAVWYAFAAGTNASNVITPTYAGGVSFIGIAAGTFHSTVGWATDPLDAVDLSTDTLTSPGINTKAASALIVGSAQRNGTGSAWTAGSGFTEVTEDASNVQQMQFKSVAAPLSNVSYSVTNAGNGGPFIITAFEETAGGGGGGGAAMFARIFTGY
jgi:hypothetical protein